MPPPQEQGAKRGGEEGYGPPTASFGCALITVLPWEPHDKGEWGSGGVGGVGVIRGGVPGMWGVLGVMWKGPRDVGGEGGEPH